MSIKLMSIVWEVPFPTATQMLVCLKLADYANDDGTSIFPANTTRIGIALKRIGCAIRDKGGTSADPTRRRLYLSPAMLREEMSGTLSARALSPTADFYGDDDVPI